MRRSITDRRTVDYQYTSVLIGRRPPGELPRGGEEPGRQPARVESGWRQPWQNFGPLELV